MIDVMERIRTYLELCKVKISLLSVFSAVTGYLLGAPELGVKVFFLAGGVFSLACGSCALNQYQEREIDARMSRTRNRPIPAGKINHFHALYFSLVLMGIGLSVLLGRGSHTASALGLFAVVWYNGIYTHLKRRSAFAAVPGALTGAVPPLIGWVMAGGGLLSSKVLALCFFSFMWQIPHFWLFLLHYGGDYEKAGMPSLTRIFTRKQLLRIICHWTFAASLSGLLISLYVTSHFLKISLLVSAFWFAHTGLNLLKGDEHNRQLVFGRINFYMLMVLFLISVDKLVLLIIPG